MVKGLYLKLMLIVGGVFAAIIIGIVIFVYASGGREIERQGLAQAETLNQIAFEALYASMRQGGGSVGNRQVIASLQELDALTEVRVVKGESVVRQFGAAPDELPQDNLERLALSGQEAQEIHYEDGYRVIRYVTPLRVQAECQECHKAQIGAINGAVSTKISLQVYESALRWQRNMLLLAMGGGLLAMGLLIFYFLRRLVLHPLQAIQQGAATIAQGNFDYRLQVRTGDEIEALGQEFNRMAERLKQSYGWITEEQSKAITAIEASRDAIWVSDANRRLVMVNSALEELTGRRREDLIGQTCSYLMGVRTLAGDSICDTHCPFSHANNGSGAIEGCIPTTSGEDVWIEISYGHVFDGDGRLSGVVHVVRDLTERKQVERLKDEFVSMVSHELRTPLHHIKGFTTTLLQTDVEWDADAQRDFLESINRESDRLTDLVENILHFSRLEGGGLPMEKGKIQIDALLDGALQQRRNLIAGRQIYLHLPLDLPLLFVDVREIEIVLMNLIENAVKYSAPETPITLAVDCQNGQAIFSVADKGIGIPPEHHERIFSRFYRVKNNGRRTPGTGLGLAICKRIVEAHDGQVWVESEVGSGARFYFSLPVTAA